MTSSVGNAVIKMATVHQYYVAQDPFRRRKGRLGEPLFSPKQQKSGAHRKRNEKTSTVKKEGHNTKAMPQVKITPLKLNATSPLGPTDHSTRDRSKELTMTGKQLTETSPRLDKVSPLHLDNDTPKLTSGDATPREAVEASLETFRRLQKEREQEQYGAVSVQRLHQIKTKKEKTALKTALVSVDLESVDRTERRSKLSHHMRERLARIGDQSTEPSSFRTPKQQPNTATGESVKENGILSSRSLSGAKENNPKVEAPGSKHTTSTNLATIFFDPPEDKIAINPLSTLLPLNRLTTNITANDISSQEMAPTPAQSENQSEKNGAGSQPGSAAPLKAVHLQVFSEKKPSQDGPIKIPTGRITLHPGMPAYKLDLINYPPSNARQSCGRSNSAGGAESRRSLHTRGTLSTLNRPGTSHHSQRSSMLMTSEKPPQTADNGGVNIRFAGKGEVILTSASGKAPDRESR